MPGIIVLVIIAAAGIFLAVELAVRVWNRFGEKYYVHYPGLRSNMIIPEIYRPLIRHPIHFQVNSYGERADPVSAGSSSGTVLLAGGSSLLCGFLDQNSTIAACIQREIRKSQFHEVANLRVASIAGPTSIPAASYGFCRLRCRVIANWSVWSSGAASPIFCDGSSSARPATSSLLQSGMKTCLRAGRTPTFRRR